MPLNYIYTDLSAKDALRLTIDGEVYEVVQYLSGTACNEIPQATCMLAVGRDARLAKLASLGGDLAGLGTANVHAANLLQMAPARVTFAPKAEYSHHGAFDWPDKPQVIFDGYFTGLAYRKVNGKIHIIVNLIHWLFDLACSSALTKNSHATNPACLTGQAVIQTLKGAGAGQGVYVTNIAPSAVVSANVEADLWASIKNVFCSLANLETLSLSLTDGSGCVTPDGTDSWSTNDRALNALKRMEGPIVVPTANEKACSRDYTYGKPLALPGNAAVYNAIARYIGEELAEAYGHITFWDKLVGGFCPAFGMAVVPLVDTALVIADTPILRNAVWREIFPEEYDSIDLTAVLDRPLRGVGVIERFGAQTLPVGDINKQPPRIGGCFVTDSVDSADGVLMIVESPGWLQMVQSTGATAGNSSGVRSNAPSKTATTPGVTVLNVAGDTTGVEVRSLYTAYARTVLAINTLRGRTGALSGMLRFDIAPGSIIKIRQQAERFIGAEDSLSATLLGCVNRVTVAINAESGAASTTLQLTHLRTEAEAALDRAGVDGHPLFGSAIHGLPDLKRLHGAPLVPAYDIPEDPSTVPI